jgi:hypothetical protein
MLGVGTASKYGLKAFRAGRATELAASGAGLEAVLAAGEWKSKAFMRYVDETTMNSETILQEVLTHSDDED